MDRYFGKYSESVRAPVDDQTAAYMVEARRQFEDLRQVSAQLAGLMVLAAAGSDCAGPHHPMLTSARRLHEEASDAVERARVPERARRHHGYLLAAAKSLGSALAAAQTGLAIDPVLIPLRAAYRELQRASNELPGFPMVAFEQGCCGAEASRDRSVEDACAGLRPVDRMKSGPQAESLPHKGGPSSSALVARRAMGHSLTVAALNELRSERRPLGSGPAKL
jgi:hypothetical protein